MKSRTCLIAGSTGLVGSHLLEHLEASPLYSEVIAIVRRPTPSRGKIRFLTVDFQKMANTLEGLRVEDVFCCLGTTIRKARSQTAFREVDFAYPVMLGRWAAESGVSRFLVISSLGASATSRVFYSRVKGEMEQALTALPLRSLTILRPSLLVGHRSEFRPGEKLSMMLSPLAKPLLVGRLRKYRAIRADRVADAMVQLAQEDFVGVRTVESDQLQYVSTREKPL